MATEPASHTNLPTADPAPQVPRDPIGTAEPSNPSPAKPEAANLQATSAEPPQPGNGSAKTISTRAPARKVDGSAKVDVSAKTEAVTVAHGGPAPGRSAANGPQKQSDPKQTDQKQADQKPSDQKQADPKPSESPSAATNSKTVAGGTKRPAGAQVSGIQNTSTLKGEAASPSTKAGSTRSGRRTSAREQMEHLDKVGALSFTTVLPCWLISAIVHMALLLIFGLLVIPPKPEVERNLVAIPVTKPDELEDMADLPVDQPVDIDVTTTDVASAVAAVEELETMEVSDVYDTAAPQVSVELSDFGLEHAPRDSLLNEIGSYTGSGLSGRGEAARKAMVADRGGSEESEAAVALALRWLAEHQSADGSWSFDHRAGRCQGRCGDPGTLKTANLAATGMALLPFLGAGQTHKEGKYKDTVRGGLYYLGTHMQVNDNGGDMTGGGGQMYGHGIATIALCEAYAMTQDKNLLRPAQLALNFIMYAQDPVGGGWRYSPRQAGDTSAVGWQIMALKSGHLGYLQVNPNVVRGAIHFLNSVQSDGGSAYGYTGPGASPALTAVGLLCRMHLGWGHDEPALVRGVEQLAAQGPMPGNMYYNYYATQVMHHFEGVLWDAWNLKMRDFLVASQSPNGHEEGSWSFHGEDHGFAVGGRLYCTTMAAMTLEVYYRHMPLYAQESTEQDFED